MSVWGWIIFSWFTAAVALILARAFGLTSLSWWLCLAPLVLLVLAIAAAFWVFCREWEQ